MNRQIIRPELETQHAVDVSTEATGLTFGPFSAEWRAIGKDVLIEIAAGYYLGRACVRWWWGGGSAWPISYYDMKVNRN